MPDSLGLVTIRDPESPASEAYRTLRMNLQFASLDTKVRSLLVASPAAGEGKSTTLANLAVTMAQVEQEIIVVDCDLRKPRLHELFGISNEVGLTSMMLDDSALSEPPLLATPIDGLRVLPSGALPPRPADLLGSMRMEHILETLLGMCDVVLLDAPPITAVTDAAILSTKVDGVLIVLAAGSTKRESAQLAVERLSKVNANIVGAVLNNAPLDASLRGYYG